MTSRRTVRILSSALLLSLPLFVACEQDPEPGIDSPEIEPIEQGLTRTNEPSTNERTAVPGTQPDARQSIAEARCRREWTCGNIGAGKDYSSVEDCQGKIRAQWADDLNFVDCPGGIVQKELAECLEEIRDEDCASPFDTLGRIAACRESDLCKALGTL